MQSVSFYAYFTNIQTPIPLKFIGKKKIKSLKANIMIELAKLHSFLLRYTELPHTITFLTSKLKIENEMTKLFFLLRSQFSHIYLLLHLFNFSFRQFFFFI